MYKIAIAAAACSLLALASGCGDSSAQAMGDAVRGEQMAAQECVQCHHPTGNSTELWQVRIAGQNAPYLADQLHILRAGIRPSEVMNPIAANLSDSDIADLVAYWSSVEPAGAPWTAQDPTLVAEGKVLFDEGNVGSNLIACAVCHGKNGQGVAELAIPRIMGQAPVYLQNMLTTFAMVPDFGVAQPNAMHTVASAVTAAELDALLAYVTSQPWGNGP